MSDGAGARDAENGVPGPPSPREGSPTRRLERASGPEEGP